MPPPTPLIQLSTAPKEGEAGGTDNLKSRDEAHMDSLVITVNGDHMTQDWSMYADGKVSGHHTFEFKRQ